METIRLALAIAGVRICATSDGQHSDTIQVAHAFKLSRIQRRAPDGVTGTLS